MRKTETYNVVAGNLPELRFRIAGLNKKAVKLGMAPIELTEGKAFTKKMDASSEHVEMERTVVIVPVTLTGETPVLNGWEFVALLQHEDGGTLVKSVPGIEDGALKPFRNRPTACDHCETDRRRNDTFVVMHVESKAMKQVGRNCLRDFLGHANPHALAAMAEILMLARGAAELSGDEGFGGFGGGSGGSAFGMVTFITYTIAVIEEHGWLSRTKARDEGREGQATADKVIYELTRKGGQSILTKEITESMRTEAERILKVAEDTFEAADPEKLSDYEHNLRVVLASGYVPFKGAGIAASVVGYVRRLESKALELKNAADLKFVGTIGERMTFRLTAVGVHESENMYGLVTYVNFRDAEGNKLVWKASGSPRALSAPPEGLDRLLDERIKVGQEYDVTGTVERHEKNRRDGVTPETWLKRCVVAELPVAEWQARYNEKMKAEKKAAAKAKREAAKAAKKASEGGEAAPAPTAEVAA